LSCFYLSEGIFRKFKAGFLKLGAQNFALAAPKTIELGQSPAQVESALGKPEKVVNLGPKKIYIYKDTKVIFQDDKVADVQ
jgi:hypothetical protein